MRQYSDRSYAFPAAAIEKTLVIKVAIESMTGKKSRW
jgi:hypothetical protein